MIIQISSLLEVVKSMAILPCLTKAESEVLTDLIFFPGLKQHQWSLEVSQGQILKFKHTLLKQTNKKPHTLLDNT